jgi:hypothetical protein
MKEDSHQVNVVHVKAQSNQSSHRVSDKQKLHTIQPGEGLGIEHCVFMPEFHAIMDL